MKRLFVLFVVGVLAARSANAEDANRPESAADIVGRIIRQEEAVNDLSSLYLRFEGKWTRPPAAIARRIAELKKEIPGFDPSKAKTPDLEPESAEVLELAFDRKRLRSLHESPHDRYDLRIWDGARAIIHERYEEYGQEHYAFDVSPHQFIGENFFLDLSWKRMGSRQFWFESNKLAADDVAKVNGAPTDYAIVGKQDFRGRQCLVLENRPAMRRLFVGADDHQLHGIQILFIPRDADPLSRAMEIWGKKLSSPSDISKYESKLTDAELQEAEQRYYKVMWDTMRPLAEHYLDDYREIAPGVSFPFKQGYTIFTSEGAEDVDGKRELTLVKCIANQPLEDGLFKMEFKDGVQVHDWGHDPPLHYKYDYRRTPEEFQKIVATHEQEDKEFKRKKAERDKLIGQQAPPFPEATWLSSGPLGWSKLKGKVIVLHFWAHWCGPCHNDLAGLEQLHQAESKNGMVVIGVHASGSEEAEVKKEVEQYSLHYPVVIDVAGSGRAGAWGALTSAYGVNYLPLTVVVDREGKVAALGAFNEMIGPAMKLLERQTTE